MKGTRAFVKEALKVPFFFCHLRGVGKVIALDHKADSADVTSTSTLSFSFPRLSTKEFLL